MIDEGVNFRYTDFLRNEYKRVRRTRAPGEWMKKLPKYLIMILLIGLSCRLGGPPADPQPIQPGEAVTATSISPSPTSPPTEINLALFAPVSAENSLPGFGPEKIVDGIEAIDADNWWSAGDYAPQRIEIDLGVPSDIVRIRLIASQSPDGETLHLVLGRREGSIENVTLGQLAGNTVDGQEFILNASSTWTGIRYVIVQTVKSPSWVAWREVQVFGKPGSAGSQEIAPEATAGPRQLIAADLVFVNGNILTMDPNLPQAEAIAIKGDRIIAVGSVDEMQLYISDDTRVVDLAGWTVTPGFIDSHSHRIGDRFLYGFGDQGPEQVIQDAIEGGWTSLHELFVFQDRLDELQRLSEADALRVRVSAYLTMNFHYDRDDWWTAYTPLQQFGPGLQIAGLKITLDQEWGETVFFNQQQMTEMVGFAADRGWQIATHAFTPATDRMALNAYGEALARYPDADFRYRLEHVGVIDDEGIQQMADLGVLASVQFTNTSKYIEDESFKKYIPQAQWPLVSRWRDMINAGVLLIGNTDSPWCCTPWRDPNSPITTGTVMDAIYQAVTRVPFDGREPEPFQVAQVLTVAEALELLTIRGAYAAHQEAVLGSLTPGKYADLVVLSADPLRVPVDEIPDIEILLSVIGGRTEYCPPGQVEICP